MKDKFFNYIDNLQRTITNELEKADGLAKFKVDHWERPEGGGGRSCVIENGKVFEKGGVNVSKVYGELPEVLQKKLGVSTSKFLACGISLVIHPKNPFVPTTHANWRYFELYNENDEIVDQWFGGGLDLTPYYIDEQDCVHWHTVCKRACEKHSYKYYPKFKEECDKYFWNEHRNEARGIGGLFFDYLRPTEETSLENWYDFVTTIGDAFLVAYMPIVQKHKYDSYTMFNRKWQEIRHGRYVEFNLIHDRGTLFGLKTNGRIESILMSLPSTAQWIYDYHPNPGTSEEKLVQVLQNPRDWAV